MFVCLFLLTWMSTQGMALKATDWRRELLGDTGSISRQESSLVLWLSFEELWWWWLYSGLFELDEIWLVLDNSLSVMLDEILLKLAANLSMRKVSLILGLSQLFDLRRCVHVNFIEIWCQYKKKWQYVASEIEPSDYFPYMRLCTIVFLHYFRADWIYFAKLKGLILKTTLQMFCM